MSDVPLVFKIYLWVVGGSVVLGGLWLLRRNLSLLVWGERIAGTMVGWNREHDAGEGTTFHFHRIAYRDARGEPRQFESRLGGSGKPDEIGRTLPLLLIPGTPDRVELARPVWLVAAPLILLAFGGTVAALPFL